MKDAIIYICIEVGTNGFIYGNGEKFMFMFIPLIIAAAGKGGYLPNYPILYKTDAPVTPCYTLIFFVVFEEQITFFSSFPSVLSSDRSSLFSYF